MKIYLAGFKTIEKYWQKSTQDIYLLSSYMEHKSGKFGKYVLQENHLLDSGAFTFLNNKKSNNINWEQYVINYAKFIKQHNIKYFFELDIDSIVGIKEVERLRNILENITEQKCIPVWHKSRGLDYWKQMCKEYDYVAIGGIVTKEIKKSQYDVFFPLLKIARENNTKVHGLGFTNIKGIKKYKFYSVDSTNWLNSRFGDNGLYIFSGDNIKNIRKPDNSRKKDLYAISIHNFTEWLKFQKYAEKNL